MKKVQRSVFALHSVVNGRYELVEFLGSGGSGYTVLAKDKELQECSVVLKFLHADLLADEEYSKRFQNEVLLARELAHRNIVRVFDIGKTDRGDHFISMEHIAGTNAKVLLQQHRRGLPLEQASTILRGIAAGMAFAHAHGIIHRDLKPDNILITPEGTAKITDFGLARMLTVPSSLTTQGTTVGTPAYMSPEQYRGEVLDPRCDIYSFGIMAYELLFGSKPFDNDNYLKLAELHLFAPLPFPDGSAPIPLGYMRLLERCCQKKPARRFQTFNEVQKALDRLAAKTPPARTLVLRRSTLSTAVWKVSWHLRTRALALLLVLALLLAGAAGLVASTRANPRVLAAVAGPLLRLEARIDADLGGLTRFLMSSGLKNRLPAGFRPHADKETLLTALRIDEPIIAELALAGGARPELSISLDDDVYPLLLAAVKRNKSAALIQALTNHSADLHARSEDRQESALILALKSDELCGEVFNAIIAAVERRPEAEQEEIVNMRDRSGKTALIYAVQKKDFDAVKMIRKLLRFKFVRTDDEYHKTALMYGVETGDLEKVRAMLSDPMVAAVKDSKYEGKTALFAVIERRDGEMFDLLIERGVSVDEWDSENQTTLMHAVLTKQRRIALKIINSSKSERFLEMRRTKDNASAADLARSSGMEDVARMLDDKIDG